MNETSPRIIQEQAAALLAAGLVGADDEAVLAAIGQEMETIVLSGGETLMQQGDAGDALYVVVSGRLRVFVERRGKEEIMNEIGRGEVVGEMALFSAASRSATVRAIRDTELIKLSRAGFERIAHAHPPAVVQLTRTIVARMQRLLRSSPAAATVATIAIVPIHPQTPVSDFSRRLQQALSGYGSTLVFDAEGFDRAFGQPGASQTAADHALDAPIIAWLGDREAEHAYIVYQADPTWTPWTERCLRQADRILLVASAESDPSLSALEQAMANKGESNHTPTARTEFVLWHPATATYPQGTGRWLEKRHVHTHHHVRLDNLGDMERLARRLTGRAVGLVLGGGAARGFAHIGVVRALQQAGIAIDLIGGASIGAQIGGLYALDWDYQQFWEASKRLGSPKQIFDRTLPLVAMMESKKVTRMMHELYDDHRIEDLWRPFFAVASNLTRAEPVIFQQGPLWEAVRSSIAIPGVFTPMLHEDQVLVDGGVMDNLPIDVMRDVMEAGRVIAVNASPAKTKLRKYQFGGSVSGWRVLWSRLNPLARPIHAPSITGILLRSLELNSAHAVEHELATRADLLIEPQVEQYHAMDWGAYAGLIEAGYAAASEQLASWPATVSAP